MADNDYTPSDTEILDELERMVGAGLVIPRSPRGLRSIIAHRLRDDPERVIGEKMKKFSLALNDYYYAVRDRTDEGVQLVNAQRLKSLYRAALKGEK